jgi:hypothetical protein
MGDGRSQVAPAGALEISRACPRVVEVLRHQEALARPEATAEGLPQRRALLALPPFGQGREADGIGFATNQRPRYRSSGLALTSMMTEAILKFAPSRIFGNRLAAATRSRRSVVQHEVAGRPVGSPARG